MKQSSRRETGGQSVQRVRMKGEIWKNKITTRENIKKNDGTMGSDKNGNKSEKYRTVLIKGLNRVELLERNEEKFRINYIQGR